MEMHPASRGLSPPQLTALSTRTSSCSCSCSSAHVHSESLNSYNSTYYDGGRAEGSLDLDSAKVRSGRHRRPASPTCRCGCDIGSSSCHPAGVPLPRPVRLAVHRHSLASSSSSSHTTTTTTRSSSTCHTSHSCTPSPSARSPCSSSPSLPHSGATPPPYREGSRSSTAASTPPSKLFSQKSSWSLLLTSLFLVSLISSSDACSSRSTPKPRPPSPTMRPNITFQTYACPPAYAAWYCLNGATCFTVKIGTSILYNCECADGYMGQRCEFKDLDGTYLPSRERLKMALSRVKTAATSSPLLGLLLVILGFVGAAMAFTRCRTRHKLKRIHQERSEYSEDGDTSYELTPPTAATATGVDSSASDLSEVSPTPVAATPEKFWRESESPPKSRCSPSSAGHRRASTPKLPGHVNTGGQEEGGHIEDDDTKSELESVNQNSPAEINEQRRALTPPPKVYLPESSSKNAPIAAFINPRSFLFGGSKTKEDSRAVRNNTLSFKIDNSSP